jgi:hypothetical protein
MRCRSGKIGYRDELGAKIALATRSARDKGEKRYYLCNLCSRYHLTSQEQKTEIVNPPGD